MTMTQPALALSIQPLSTTLRMHGRHDPSTSYSLSGTVDVRLADHNGVHMDQRSMSVLLTSLIVTFHGQATHTQLSHPRLFNTARTFNLCSISEELIKEPAVLHFNEISHDNNEPLFYDQQSYSNNQRKESPVNHYSVIFDLLTIPGWLPASISAKHSLPHHTAIEHPWNISSAVSSTSYSLSAVASYRILRTNALPPKQPRIFQPQYPSLFPSANENRSREDDALLENAEQESAELGLTCLLNTCNPLSTLALTLSSHFGTDSVIDYERIENVCEEDESPASTSTTNAAAATANPVEITLVRHLVELPPASSVQQPLGAAAPEAHKQRFPSTRYAIKPDSTSSVSPIPSELVSRLQLSVELPAFVDVNEPSLDVCMRMRLLPESQEATTTTTTTTTTPIGRLRATHVEIDAEEHATFRTKRDEGYGGRVGVHFGDQQEQDQTTATDGPVDLPSESTGSAAPKRSSRPTWLNTAFGAIRGAMTSSFSSRLVYANAATDASPDVTTTPRLPEEKEEGTIKDRRWRVVKSILDENAASSFWLDSESQTENEDEEDEEQEGYVLDGNWATIRMTAGLLTATPSHNASSAAPFEYSSEESGEKTNKRRIAPAMHTPYLRVAHLIRIATYLSFEKDGQIVTDVVRFELPLCFVVAPPQEETSSSSPSSPSLSVSVCRDSSPASSSHSLSTGLAPVLPAYSQLFHEDGEARIDATRGVPPVYRPSTPLGSSSVPSQQQLLPEGEVVISKPELVPVGTTVIDWEKIPSLI